MQASLQAGDPYANYSGMGSNYNVFGGGSGVIGYDPNSSGSVAIGNATGDTGGIYNTTPTVPTDRTGVTVRTVDSSGVDLNNDVNVASNVASGALVPAIQALQQPKTFADLIFGLQPTQPKELTLPATASVTTMPTTGGGSNLTTIFLVLAVVAIAATMYYAKHKSLSL